MRFLIRADASAETGSGHVMRILALAQGLRRHGHTASFLLAAPRLLRDRLDAEGFECTPLDGAPGSSLDAATTIRHGRVAGVDWILADGYSFDVAYQQAIQDAGFRLLLVDDNGLADGYTADLVLNQSLHASPSLYGDWFDPDRFVLGSRFVLLREEFFACAGWKREVRSDPRSLLVTLGGLPSASWISRVVPALADLGLEVRLVGNLDAQALDRIDPSSNVQLLGYVEDMVGLIKDSDIGMTAGGGTTREFLFLGLPFVVIDVAANQEIQSRHLQAEGLAVSLGDIDTLDGAALRRATQELATNTLERQRMSAAGQRTIDGLGVDRVVARLTDQRGGK